MTFFRRHDEGRFAEAQTHGDVFGSDGVPAFELDLRLVREKLGTYPRP
jgi:hypothetical protein